MVHFDVRTIIDDIYEHGKGKGKRRHGQGTGLDKHVQEIAQIVKTQ